ncbi:MAG: hypothetical protein OXG79_00415 [Chloroflexi bacterium]|nr:hypothetical protein [Chloroflexota bacterium]
MANRIRLPHEGEWVDRLLREVKDAVWETRTVVIADVKVTYSICDPWPLGGEIAIYDHDGDIYLPESYVRSHPSNADLVAYHEQIEIGHKLAGRSHAYAHRRALLMELLAAKQSYDEVGLRAYVHQRVFGYPDWKIPDKDAIEERLYELLSADRPLRGRLIAVITEAKM